MPGLASAPGKVLLAGEYAVLEGAPAVVVAVDRRATARLAGAPQRLSTFLEAARHEIAAAHGEDSGEARRAARVIVDTAPLAERGLKLGLGSSAAATVAAVACALGELDRERIHALAHRAHARAQEPRGARGSGADVAASVHGGLLVVQRASDGPLQTRRLAWPRDLELLLVWSGVPADTPRLVAAVRAARERDARGHAAILGELGAVARDLAAAFERGDGAGAVAAILHGAGAVRQLGRAAGVPLAPPQLDELGRIAAAHGGAAKPTGAGGGDLLACLVPAARAAAFRSAVAVQGMTLIATCVTDEGVSLA